MLDKNQFCSIHQLNKTFYLDVLKPQTRKSLLLLRKQTPMNLLANMRQVLISTLVLLEVKFQVVKNRELPLQEPLSKNQRFFCLTKLHPLLTRRMKLMSRNQLITSEMNLEMLQQSLSLTDSQPLDMQTQFLLWKRAKLLNKVTTILY